MGQVIIDLDDATEARLNAAAHTQGMPVSRWIAELIRDRTANEWPPSVRALAGAWSDLPDAETLRREQGEDVAREPF